MSQQPFRSSQTSCPSLLILVGPAGSGKTTWARNYVRGRRGTRIVSRDSLRQQLFGYDEENVKDYYVERKTLHERETSVTKSQFALIKCLLEDGYSVVVDDTNLMPAVVDGFVNSFKGYKILFKCFDVGLDTALARNAARRKRVDESIVRNQWSKFERMKLQYNFSTREPNQHSIEQSHT